jgi:hypothetical protein
VAFVRHLLNDFPSVRADGRLLERILSDPGGPAKALGAFFSHACYYAWLGAGAITAIGILAWLGTCSLLRCFTGRRVSWLGYLPTLLLSVAYEGLENPTACAVLFLLVLWSAVFHCRLTSSSALCRSGFAVVMNIVLYAAAGPASLAFALLVAMHEGFVRRKSLSAATCLLVGATTPLVMAFLLYDMTASDAYARILPMASPRPDRVFFVTGSLYLFLPVAATVALLANRLRRHPAVATLTLWSGAILPFVAALLVIPPSRHHLRRLDVRMASFSMHRRWPEMLAFARTLPAEISALPYFNHEICKALHYNGRLGSDLFSFPQTSGVLHLMGTRGPMPGTRYAVPQLAMADVSLGLGELNYAEKLAYEELEFRGESPMILERLAVINIAKRRTAAATILLNVMKQTPFHGKAASTTLAMLKTDPSATTSGHIQHLRTIVLLEDFVGEPGAIERLQRLLKRNSSNRMAFEYLMASLLLTGRTAEVVSGLEILHSQGFGYEQLPTHYEEAMAIYEIMTGKPLVIGAWRVSPDMQARARRFVSIAEELDDKPGEAQQKLAPEFGRTYFFFLRFARSGVWE